MTVESPFPSRVRHQRNFSHRSMPACSGLAPRTTPSSKAISETAPSLFPIRTPTCSSVLKKWPGRGPVATTPRLTAWSRSTSPPSRRSSTPPARSSHLSMELSPVIRSVRYSSSMPTRSSVRTMRLLANKLISNFSMNCSGESCPGTTSSIRFKQLRQQRRVDIFRYG